MSHVRGKSFLEKVLTLRSVKGFAQEFLLPTMAGQKIFLYNNRIPRIINLSFNEENCMFSCKMCPYSEFHVRSHYKEAARMSFQTLEHIVDSIPNDPYYTFDISSIGETLRFKSLPDFIKYLKSRKPLVNTIISTNGVLLNEGVFLKLAESGLDSIQISLFAHNDEEHRYITGTNSFARVKSNVESVGLLKKKLKLKKPYLQAFIIEYRENQHSSSDFIKYWSQYVDHAFVRPMYNAGRTIEGMTPTFKQDLPQARYPCIMPWYSIAIRSDGDVLPCYFYHWHEEGWNQTIGNIDESNLEIIWKSSEHLNFRRAHLTSNLDKFPICKRCDTWNAYTCVWSCDHDQLYKYDSVKIADFFRSAPRHRGA
jgi:radical SAM protein with 4Fe4S-binding SPASM domain